MFNNYSLCEGYTEISQSCSFPMKNRDKSIAFDNYLYFYTSDASNSDPHLDSRSSTLCTTPLPSGSFDLLLLRPELSTRTAQFDLLACDCS